jgi:hypothetical protein
MKAKKVKQAIQVRKVFKGSGDSKEKPELEVRGDSQVSKV